MTLLRVLLVLLSAGLLVAIIQAFGAAAFFASFAEVAANPWGFVGLLDLYLGFVVFAVLLVLFEPNRGLAIGLVVATFVLGNLVSLVWLAWRLPLLARRIRG
ncbi:hypothetical protein [Methylobrevis albus]|uniref:hypothetical protein n=1 Tax=Methylobrevis albus TaxID=2793297 RepID=UPI001F41EF01|nr:hypothetical protein [Methylobrevis albus]